MNAILSLCFTAAAIVGAPLQPGDQLTYRGVMIAEKGEDFSSRKLFDVEYLIEAADGPAPAVHWTIKEDGRGGWPWTSRFGAATVADRWPAETGPALLYEREDIDTVVPLLALHFESGREFADDVSWKDGKIEYRVEGKTKFAGRSAWQIEGRTGYGRKRTVWVAEDSPLLLGVDEVVFIGQGEQHQVRYQLVDHQSAPAESRAAAIGALKTLAQIRDRVTDKPRLKKLDLTAEQIALVQTEAAKAVVKSPAGGLAAEVVAAAADDAKSQKGRAGAVAALEGGAIGKQAPAFELTGVAGASLKSEQLTGQVTVLHFWEYRDTPLREPYGQTGYLDYLQRERKDEVRVYGVCVNPDAIDSPRKVEASAKKFKTFMNLSYPVLIDQGDVIRKFGDPRVAGVDLPLFVVIDPAGKVSHYFVGEYEVSRDRGLDALNEAISQAITTAADKGE
ncbi:TlpA family protein disulfide reductase [Lignipirellula cremea]|uniref:Thiol-disulfide oxidoreductase n=1 Tax=Lignipirellula cremea TaxID=2528010 RepID=A0A518E042_9BACT|nr:redoxin domain-containing protein [Lignipirellula cremea]QDU97454.1 thiol-disulfide oxidoreductase [Lignipirellula cremea]